MSCYHRTRQNVILKKYPNDLEILLQEYPDKPWNWIFLSRNNRITEEFIISHIDYPWNYHALSDRRSDLSIEFIESHIDKPWNWARLSRNRNVTLEFILENKDRSWNWVSIDKRFNSSVEFLEEHLSQPYDWQALSSKYHLPLNFIEKYTDKPWDWNSLSKNYHITEEFIKKHIDKPWEWEDLYEYTEFALPIFEKYHSDNMQYLFWLLSNPHITLDVIERYISENKYDFESINIWTSISRNPNITVDFIEKYIDKPWDWNMISRNQFQWHSVVFEKIYKYELTNVRQIFKDIFLKVPHTAAIPELSDVIEKYMDVI